jgi:glycosyltransferase involved in cell wall biosynthesis
MPTVRSLPLVVIATPVYNGGPFLAEAMACVQEQTYPNLVHCVLDNASTDETASTITNFKHRRVPIICWRNDQTVSMADNWNSVLRLIPRGARYFRLLPADDLMTSTCIEKMVSVGERRPDVGIIGCQEWFGERLIGDGLPTEAEVFDGRTIMRGALLNKLCGSPPHLHCLFRIPGSGLPDPFYLKDYNGAPVLSGDMDAAMSALSRTNFGFVHEPLVFTRLHSNSVTEQTVAPARMKLVADLQLIDRWGRKAFDSEKEYQMCRKRHLRFYYRHLLLWQITRQSALEKQHREWLRRASALPSTADYVMAVAEWLGKQAARYGARIASSLGFSLPGRVALSSASPRTPPGSIGRLPRPPRARQAQPMP